MTQLIEERFEQIIGQKLNSQTVEITTELKKYMDEQTEDLARIIANTIVEPFNKRFDDLEDILKVKDDVLTLKSKC